MSRSASDWRTFSRGIPKFRSTAARKGIPRDESGSAFLEAAHFAELVVAGLQQFGGGHLLQAAQGFGEGVIRFADVVYFFGATALVLYTATFLLGRRHW